MAVLSTAGLQSRLDLETLPLMVAEMPDLRLYHFVIAAYSFGARLGYLETA